VHWLLLLKGIGAVEALRPPQKSGGGGGGGGALLRKQQIAS
jgi:hypothetical protein